MNALEPRPHLIKVSCVETPVAINSVQPVKIIPYKKQRLGLCKLSEVTVSSINAIDEFFCQMTSFREQLKKMSQILNSGLDFLPLSLAECEPGMPVCVKYSDDNMWYRAQITEINNESDIEVFFVDYGKKDNANLRDVRKMIPNLMKFETQCFKCSLYDVHLPDDQSLRDAMFDIFKELTTGQTLTVLVKTVLEDIKYDVLLWEENGKLSINEKLESSFLTLGIVPVSDIENLVVTHFEAPNSFFALFKKLDSEKLTQMEDAINEYYCNAKNSQFKPKSKNLVCVKSLTDKQFYRGRVDVVKNSACEVYLIDCGFKEQISLVDIHPMNKKFAQYPPFGITCTLEKLPVATPVEKLSSLMAGQSIQARMLREHNGKWLISLTENFADNVNILELLRQHELVGPPSIHGILTSLKLFIEKIFSSGKIFLNLVPKEAVGKSTDENPPDRKDTGTNTLPEEDSELLYIDPPKEKDDSQTELSKNFETLHNNQRCADVILKLGEHKFPAHKLVLRCRSKVFEAMFEHGMQENRQESVEMADMEAGTVKDMLRYIYCGKVRPLSPKDALSLYAAADRYDLQELVLYCRKIVLSALSINNI